MSSSSRSTPAKISPASAPEGPEADLLHPSDAPCAVCGQRRGGKPVATLRPSLAARLHAEGLRDLSGGAIVCAPCLAAAKIRHTRTELEQERGELSEVEHDIASRAATHATIADELERSEPATFGQRAADTVARIGGSWWFVGCACGSIVAWCVLNIAMGLGAFDPYPFIFLNLVLSSTAAIQAPIILMSQGRMAQIDRSRAAQDFRINLKAELEVAALHEKMDHLLHQQWNRMVELQQLQLEILEELRRTRDEARPPPEAD
jgi:uncharacterized membrane protein